MIRERSITGMNQRRVTINILQHELPEKVHSVCAAYENNQCSIYLNSKDTEKRQIAAFLHECLHIYHDDNISTNSADQIEKERHQELIQLLNMLLQEEREESYDPQ